MKICTTTVLKTIDGDELKFPAVNGNEAQPFTLRKACIEALMVPREADTGEVKMRKWDIATRIANATECELTPEEVALIKAAIGLWGGPLLVGQSWTLLNG